MIRIARRRERRLIAAAAVIVVVALRAMGLLQPWENMAADLRARLLVHESASDIVVVGIDAPSLDQLPGWPWPRSIHAELLNRLASASAPPRSIFFDIDFSSTQRVLEDAALELALRNSPVPVQLPAFVSDAAGNGGPELVTRPLERFERHADLVAVNRVADSDSLTRTWARFWAIDGKRVPSVIDPQDQLADDRRVLIDYSISPASFRYLSYVDLLDGHVPEEVLAGKSVFIGNVSVELGDIVAVPVFRSLPGVVVQALAAETVARGAPRELPGWASIVLLMAWAALAAAGFRGNWGRNLAVLAMLGAGIGVVSVIALAAGRLWVEAATPMASVALVFLGVTLRSLDRESARAFTFALGMRRRDALLKSIVQSSSDCILCIEETGRIRTANPAAGRLFGCTTGQLVGESITKFIDIAEGTLDAERLAKLHGEARECDARRMAGEVFPVEIRLSRVRLASERLFTASVRDISERRVQQQRLQHQATHDALTGLPNRAALMTQLESALGEPREPDTMALFMLDLCRFKEVNDALGHHIGDEVLCEVSRRFTRTLGPAGMIARIGGDEFTALLQPVNGAAECASLAQALAHCLSAPIDVAGISIEVGVSIGIARHPQDGSDAGALLRSADVAMYAAKRRGTSHEFYDPATDENTVRRLAIGGELRSAISSDALQLHFQPQVNLRTGRVESCEALLRWLHPQHGAVSPAEFIAIAEATDLIRPLTEWTLEKALAECQACRSAGMPVRVAVNLSARILQDTGFPARLRQLLARADVPPELLELEITESAMMLDPARALRVIQECHATGVMISIDDFGTGYSSLGYLRDLPVHALKLDKSFVKGMRTRGGDRIIVESTAQMAHALKLELVAEGVETQWDADVLAAAGYDFAQGFLYSAALPAERFRSWVADFNGAALQDAADACSRIKQAQV